jgi:uncharacterized protein (TIGR02594 family)
MTVQEACRALGLSEQDVIAAPWLIRAYAELGTQEVPGSGDSPRIVEYLAAVGEPADDEIPWCSAFLQWVMTEEGIKGTGKANARSWLDWGLKANGPRPGAVTVLWRDSPKSWKGHVGFFIRKLGKQVLLLGGNQGDRVCLLSHADSRVLDYRWPSSAV